MDISDGLNPGNEEDVIELHAHYDILTDEKQSSLTKNVDICSIGLTLREEAEVQEIILKAEREFYNDHGKSSKTPQSIDDTNHNSIPTPHMYGLLGNQHKTDTPYPKSAEPYLNCIQDKREQNKDIRKEVKDDGQRFKHGFMATAQRDVGAKSQPKTKRDCEASETVLKIGGEDKLSKEDKDIMLDLVDIALGEKATSEEKDAANDSETNNKTREDIIKLFVKAHFKTMEENNLQHKLQGNNEKENSNCKSKLSETATAIADNVEHNTIAENSISNFQVHDVTNPPPSTPEKVLTPVSEEVDETEYDIGLSSAEEKEINEIILLAERAYKGKIDTTRDSCKVEDESKYMKYNKNMDTAGLNTNRMSSILTDVSVNSPTESNMDKKTNGVEKQKQFADYKIGAAKTNRQSATHFSKSQESELGVGRTASKTNHDTKDAEREEEEFDYSNRSMKLPMNDKHGRFFINRSLFPVSEYQEGLSEKRWNPTSVLNELCTKMNWMPPEFGEMVYRTDKGFMVPVTIRGREFLSTQWAHNKKSAKHLASTHFLKYLGFRFTYFDNSNYEGLDRFDKNTLGYKDLDEESYHSSRNTLSAVNERESCSERHYVSRSRRSVKEYERVRKPDSKKLRSEEFSFNLTSRSSIIHRGSKSSDRSESSNEKDSPDLRDSLTLKNTLQSLNLKDILKLKDSAVIVINNFESPQGASRRRRHSTSSSSPSPRERFSSKQKEVGDTPRTPSNAFRRPARWENVDDIKPFVPRNLYQDNGDVSSRDVQNVDRSHHPRPVASRPHRCRCKPSFPHPSIHPWRTELGPGKYFSSETSRAPATNASGREHCAYVELATW